VGIDIGTEEGLEVLYELAATCDVFLTNFLPAARQKLKIDVEHIRKVNPNIIYARGSALGNKGPERENGGFDSSAFWARGGSAMLVTPKELEGPLGMPGPAYGDTIGAMSTGARSVFNTAYEPLLFDVTRIPFPSAGCEQQTLDALEAACRSADAAVFVVEPLVLGAGGMLVYSADTLREMRRICAAHGVLFVADEVMTGFGRTGTLFACEQAGIVPDIACYAKGITGGSLPLAVTMCSAEIFEAHYSTDRARTFFHSSSFTANPIACAAALANLDIWESEDVRGRIARLAAMQEERLLRFTNDARFTNVRRIGTIAALDLRARDAGYLATIGPALYEFFISRGLLLRPLGNTIYILPPYCIEASELDALYAAIDEAGDRFC
jgi:adenosylmethionine-8-amino-7-oxononanoate aminotransferase